MTIALPSEQPESNPPGSNPPNRRGGGVPLSRIVGVVLLCLAYAVWFWVDVRRRTITDGSRPHQTDLSVYTEAAAAFFDGRDPYAVTNPCGWHYLYPPMFALLLAPLGGWPLETQAALWFALSVAMSFGNWRECWRIRRLLAPPELRELQDDKAVDGFGWIMAVACVAVTFPMWNCLQRGQVGLAVVYPLLLGYRLTLEGGSWRTFLGGLLLAFPVVLKLTPLLPVAFLVALRLGQSVLARGERPRGGWIPAAGAAAGILLFVLMLPAAVIGWDENLRHLETWHRKVVAPEDAGGANNFNQESLRNQSLENAVYQAVRLVGGADAATTEAAIEPVVNATKAGLLLLLAVCGWAAARRPDPRRDAALYGLAGALTLLISPLSWGHHYVILLIGAAFVPHYLWCAGARRAAIITAAAPAVLTLLHYVALPYAGRIGLLGLGTTAWCVSAAVTTLWFPPPRPASTSTASSADWSALSTAA